MSLGGRVLEEQYPKFINCHSCSLWRTYLVKLFNMRFNQMVVELFQSVGDVFAKNTLEVESVCDGGILCDPTPDM